VPPILSEAVTFPLQRFRALWQVAPPHKTAIVATHVRLSPLPLMLPQAAAAALRTILKPLSRVLAGIIAVRIIRFVLKRVGKVKVLDKEFERDVELWFRASLVLLLSTANMEHILFGWIPFDMQDRYASLGMALRLLLVMGVIETMPDQEIFSVLHRGPPAVPFGKGFLSRLWKARKPILSGMFNQHIKRSSPVFAILAAIFGGDKGTDAWAVGWCCYAIALFQYLYIALVTSSDKAQEALVMFDEQMKAMRQELKDSLSTDPPGSESTPTTPSKT
jgi:hypothetical protein